jgi:hypothetical protein
MTPDPGQKETLDLVSSSSTSGETFINAAESRVQIFGFNRFITLMKLHKVNAILSTLNAREWVATKASNSTPSKVAKCRNIKTV